MIGDDVEILISEIKNDQVKIGITAPKSIRVYRAEVYNDIQKENVQAARSQLPDNLDDVL